MKIIKNNKAPEDLIVQMLGIKNINLISNDKEKNIQINKNIEFDDMVE